MKLTLGIIYGLLLQGKTDEKNETDFMEGIYKVILGNEIKLNSRQISSFRKEVTEFKKCKIDTGSYIKLTKKNYDSVSKKDGDLRERFKDFIDNNMYTNKLEMIVKYIIYIISTDKSIKDNETFDVLYDKKIYKNQLKKCSTIEIELFLASVVQYIINNEVLNTTGKETFEMLFTQTGERAQWKFNKSNNDLIEDMSCIKIIRFEPDIVIMDTEINMDFSENEGLDPRKYYNLLVTNSCPKHKKDIFEIYIDRKRVIGNIVEDKMYNNTTALEILSKKSGNVCSIIESLPTLYMEEHKVGTEQKAYLGRIISIHGKETFIFKKLSVISMDIIVDSLFELDIINSFELNRTHLAIKKANIIEVLNTLMNKKA
ncbi:hypothetical protein [Ligilactobacillus animalis]|jgi:hypothetical protein|uniref:hypothetical protein n=1 Tax=Ligilactobacillus animalis TaxID=1605 RepID=UPI00259AC93C|nr:hypothetical protein [Ligilactobacillus animalis]